MPGRSGPYKSRRLLSLDSRWLGYANDAGILTPFGFLFSCTGVLTLIAFARSLSSMFSEPTDTIPRMVLGAFGILVIGCGHFIIGSMILLRDRVWLNNQSRSILKVTGWMGAARRVQSVSEYTGVEIINAPKRWFTRGADYAVALIGPGIDPIVVGYGATTSIAESLRREIEGHLFRQSTSRGTDNPIDRSGGATGS